MSAVRPIDYRRNNQSFAKVVVGEAADPWHSVSGRENT